MPQITNDRSRADWMPAGRTVAVLMSAYNGEKYLDCQIDSIIKQEGVNVRLIVRDDGSSDRTPDILQNWQDRFPEKISILEEHSNLGFAASFSRLVELTAENDDFDCFAFADQDDFWMPDKLLRGVKALERIGGFGENLPCGYASNTMLVDADLNEIGLRWNPDKVNVSREHALVENFATGCTMLFNRPAARRYIDSYTPDVKVHDFRLYQICVFSGRFVWDGESRILYRQHASNQIGRQPFWGRMKKRYFSKKYKEHILEKQNRNFLRDYKDHLSADDRELIAKFCEYRKSPMARLRLIADSKIGYSNFEADFFYRLKIVLGTV